jgi:hypothetical protein
MRKLTATLARTILGAALLLPAAGTAEGSRDLPLGTMDGGSCPVAEDQSQARAEMIARLEARMRAEVGEAGGDVVALNGRGYRYESDRVPAIARELQVLEIEMQRARAAAKAEAAGGQ